MIRLNRGRQVMIKHPFLSFYNINRNLPISGMFDVHIDVACRRTEETDRLSCKVLVVGRIKKHCSSTKWKEDMFF